MLKQNKKVIQQFVLLWKIQEFAKVKMIDVDKKKLEALIKPNLKKCKMLEYRKWSRSMKNLLMAEIFFQERFLVETDQSNSIDKEKVKDSIKLFFDSINKKMDHHFYF